MRFTTLVLKELGENAGIVLFGLILLAIGWLIIHSNAEMYADFEMEGMETKAVLSQSATFGGMGFLLLFVSCVSGAAIGIQQFCYPEFSKTWAFLLHRSVRRSAIVLSKFLACFLLLAVSVGVFWALLYLYACKPGLFALAPPFSAFLHGWYPVGLGFLLYLGTAHTGVSQARWYTTRVFGALTAFILVLLFAFTVNLYWGVIFLVITCGVFGFIVLQMMEEKEF
jgi:hypothetical protein